MRIENNLHMTTARKEVEAHEPVNSMESSPSWEVVNKCLVFYGTRRFVTVFVRVRVCNFSLRASVLKHRPTLTRYRLLSAACWTYSQLRIPPWGCVQDVRRLRTNMSNRTWDLRQENEALGITGQREERDNVGRPVGTLKAFFPSPTVLMTRFVYSPTQLKLIVPRSVSSYSSSSSSSYVCHGVRPLVDPFRSHVSRSLFRGLPRFLLPVGE